MLQWYPQTMWTSWYGLGPPVMAVGVPFPSEWAYEYVYSPPLLLLRVCPLIEYGYFFKSNYM